MINSLCGSMGSVKTENSCSMPQPSSSNEVASECRKTTSLSTDMEHSSLTPPSLSFPSLKFENDGDIEVQSPDNSMWETFLYDQLDCDFMILSPVRNLPSPLTSSSNYSYNYAQALQGQSLSGCSPPRHLSQLGAFSSAHKGKGLSPLQKVFNSPNNHHHMQPDNLSLPGTGELLQDYQGDAFETFSTTTKPSGIGGTVGNYDISSSLQTVFDSLAMQNSSRFCGSLTETSGHCGSRVSPEGDVYQMGRVTTTTLSQQLKQEDAQKAHQQRQPLPQQQHHNLSHGLMAPLPVGFEQEQDSGLQLVHLLLACAEAVAKEDYMLARWYLSHLNRVVSPLGDSMQRVASCFAEALTARLASTLTTSTKPTTSSPKSCFPPLYPNQAEILKIYQIVYQACPYIKFAHFTANQAIFEAFEGEERVHVIDLDILQGYQWPAFMQALAARPGGAPFLRITGVGQSMECVREAGRCLTELANSLNVPFEYHGVAEQLEDLKPHMFNRRVGEALAVNSVNRLHRVPGNCLGSLLAMIRDQAPNIVTVVEQEASHNGPYFLGRFLEALHYYSAIFDSLDATFPPDSAQRAKVEQYIFAPEIRNIVACEGSERIERHERLEKWRKLMEGKGFKCVPLSENTVEQSKILLELYSCEGYRLTEEKGCLLLGWQDRALIAASAWRC